MSLQSAPIIASGIEFHKYSENPLHELGAKVKTVDGRIFRYVKCGATAVIAGKVYQGPATDTNEQNLTPTANSAVGDKTISLTTGAAVAANAFAGGWVVTTTGTGVGYAYEIESHAATTGAAALTLNLVDPIKVATSTSDTKLDLVANPWNGIVVAPTTLTAKAVGVGVSVIPASYYGWIQSGGPCNTLAYGTLVVGNNVQISNSTGGAVEAVDTDTFERVGVAMEAVSTTEYGLVYLTIDS